MGVFSWLYCDSIHKGKNRALRMGGKAYVPFPADRGANGIPAGSILTETSYDCYGNFAGQDIYELVAEWNKEFLTEDNLRKPERSQWDPGEEGETWYQAAVKRYEEKVNRLKDYQNNTDEKTMVEKYGKWWKREIGIDVACYNEQNAALRYPIKICAKRTSVYEEMPASKNDPNQGYF